MKFSTPIGINPSRIQARQELGVERGRVREYRGEAELGEVGTGRHEDVAAHPVRAAHVPNLHHVILPHKLLLILLLGIIVFAFLLVLVLVLRVAGAGEQRGSGARRREREAAGKEAGEGRGEPEVRRGVEREGEGDRRGGGDGGGRRHWQRGELPVGDEQEDRARG
jgi:Na+-transporting methylmalonyl-CoA/oxaloacetate decarboxylase gamma subunit